MKKFLKKILDSIKGFVTKLKLPKFDFLSKVFFIRLFLFLIVATVIMRLCGIKHISDTFSLGMMGFVTALIGIYQYKKN